MKKAEAKAKKRKKWGILATVAAAAATVVTFGAAAPALAAALGGGLTGAVVGGIGAGAISGLAGGLISGAGKGYVETGKVTGRSMMKGAFKAAAIGAVTGGVIGGIGAAVQGSTYTATQAAVNSATNGSKAIVSISNANANAVPRAFVSAATPTGQAVSTVGNGLRSIPQSIGSSVRGVGQLFKGNMNLGSMANGFKTGVGSGVKDAFLAGSVDRAVGSDGNIFRDAYKPNVLAKDLMLGGVTGGVTGALSSPPTRSLTGLA